LFSDEPKKKGEGLFDKPLPGLFGQEKTNLGSSEPLFEQPIVLSQKTKRKKGKKKRQTRRAQPLFDTETTRMKTESQRIRAELALRKDRAKLSELKKREREEFIQKAKRVQSQAKASYAKARGLFSSFGKPKQIGRANYAKHKFKE